MSSYKVLILIAHADSNKKSTAHRLASQAEQVLVSQGKEVKTIDLITEGFATNMLEGELKGKEIPEGTKRAQELITWCNHVIVFGPMWYFRYPACLYSFIERVLAYGFGYDSKNAGEDGLLKGRKVSCIMTAGGGEEFYTRKVTGGIDLIMYPTTGAFRYCGFEATRSLILGGAGHGVSAEQEEWMRKFKVAIEHLEEWKIAKVNENKELGEMDNLANYENCTTENIF